MEKLEEIEAEVDRLARSRVEQLVTSNETMFIQNSLDRNLHVQMVEEAEKGIRVLEGGIDELCEGYQDLHDQLIRQQGESAEAHRKTQDQLTQMADQQQAELQTHTEEMLEMVATNRSLDETQWKIGQVLQACGDWVQEVKEELQDQLREELSRGIIWEPERLSLSE